MQPEEYQRAGQGLPSFSPQPSAAFGTGIAGNPPPQQVMRAQADQLAPPEGELTRIYERLAQFHSRICDDRDRLIRLNERLGVSHLPQSGNTKEPQSPQAEGMLPAIDSFLQLIDASLTDLDYQIERIKLL